ncbi:MAG: nucleoside-diphosphate kinase [Acidobacteria bacterium]|nr:MAG: nucleoside-diphosphate kinase [Acidobacteriota bacterium]
MSDVTLTIIKPDAVAAGATGTILARLEAEGFTIRGLKKLHLTPAQARAFYEVHAGKDFFDSLVAFMTSGPVVVAALRRENAVQHLRDVMGPTDATKAPADTIRGQHGSSIEKNAIHGSDSDANAALETAFFFARAELVA